MDKSDNPDKSINTDRVWGNSRKLLNRAVESYVHCCDCSDFCCNKVCFVYLCACQGTTEIK